MLAPLRRRRRDARLARILDLFEEHVYAGEIRPDGHYVNHFSGPTFERFVGGRVPEGLEPGAFWESRIPAEDWSDYAAFNQRLLRGEDAEVSYRLVGLDGVTRLFLDRARPRPKADGGILVDGIISDITAREEAAERLAEARERFSSLLDVVGEHVYLAVAFSDGSLHELFQGPGADRLLGGAEADPEMENWDAAVHPDDRPRYEAYNRALGRGRDGDVEYRLVGADGVTRWVHDRAVARPRPDGTFEVSGIVSDVTERRRLEDELRASMAEMQRTHLELERARAEAELRANTDELTGALSRRRFAEIAALALAGGERCALLLLDADHFKGINDAYGHAVGDAVLVGLARRLQAVLAPGDRLARWGGEEFAVLLRQVDSEAELAERAERLRAAVGAEPIAHQGMRLGLTVSVGATLAPRGALLDALVDRADACLYAAKHQGRNRVSLRRRAETAAPAAGEPEAAAIAQALAFAGGLRDGGGELHAQEVARLAALTAARLGLPADLVERCRLGGLLHDLGKVGVPEAILAKPAPLDEAEWAIVRTHPLAGEQIVRRVPRLREAAAAVRHHHERFAGGGYPDGLAGAAIPLEARIVAAADAYAAMTAARPGSPARTHEQALDELRRCAGSQLDPAVVEALLSVLGGADDQRLAA